jgi:tyrosyl-tRNA synthetase
MKINTDPKKIEEIASSRFIENIFPSKKTLEETLLRGKKLIIYIGVDPTGSKLHLGHSTNFLLLSEFQKLGHQIIFLVGDFTAQIGDPTGKTNARKALTHKEILKNCKDYQKQVEKILDFESKQNAVKIKFNSQWLTKFNFKDVAELMSKSTVGKMIKRDMFQKRIKEKKEIYLHEFIYPLLQGYDSVGMNADIEVGGNDQTFNMMIGRDLVKIYQKREKIVIATKLLVNPKTNKKLMSKSEGNYISLDEKPNNMYGKIMALADEVILPCFELCTRLPSQQIKQIARDIKIKKLNPKHAKAILAKEIVTMYHGKTSADKAEKEFNRVFTQKKLPSDIKSVKIKDKKINILDLLVKIKMASSKGEARRTILQNGVKIDNKIQNDWKKIISIKSGMLIQVGKRKFIKIISQ